MYYLIHPMLYHGFVNIKAPLQANFQKTWLVLQCEDYPSIMSYNTNFNWLHPTHLNRIALDKAVKGYVLSLTRCLYPDYVCVITSM